MSDFTETEALRMALDAAGKRGRGAPAWLTSKQPARPPRLQPEPTGLGAADLIRAVHGTTDEATPEDEPDDDEPVAA